MNKNVGGFDRMLRVVAGVVLVALAAKGTVGHGALWVLCPF